MNTKFTDEYKAWIKDLSKENFDELVLEYLKEYHKTRNLYLSDGPYDGGIDLIYEVNEEKVKRNIQITIQKKYESKLEEDLGKSKRNVVRFGYLNVLDFYISQAITPDKKNELIRDAEVNHQMTLKIIDANELAGLAPNYKSIRSTIKKFIKTAFPSDDILAIDTKTRIFFDTLSMGKDVASIKIKFIQSLILTFLYEKTSASVDEVYNELNRTFYGKYKKSFFEAEIGHLKSIGKVIDIPNTSPKKFKLSTGTNEKLEEIDERAELQESELQRNFSQILERYKLQNETSNIVNFIIELYNANYEIDESEIVNSGENHNRKIQQIFDNLIRSLQQNHGLDRSIANDIARQLLVICKKNEFLNKTSISKMLTNLFKSDKLEEYLNTSKRIVYLDTQVLLQIICCEYEEIEHDDQLYKIVKNFLSVIRESSIPIILHTTMGYVEEVAWHVYNGLRLQRFLELDYVKDLGPSKNIFFNFFLDLKKINRIQSATFGEFIEDLLDVDAGDYYKALPFIEQVVRNLVERFELLEIKVETPFFYEKAEYEKYKKQYEVSLSYLKHDQKSYEARRHDLATVLKLSDTHYDVEDGYFAEPTFITWDTSFYEVRRSFTKFKELNHWYLYTPTKFSNTVSVMNMRIDSTAINYNIVSLVEENFNQSNDTISFLDLMNSLFIEGDAKKWKLVNNLAKLRKRLVDDGNIEDFSRVKNTNLPVDEILLLVQKHYLNPVNKKSYKDLENLFHNNDFAASISQLVESHLNDFREKNGIKMNIIEELDKMIIDSKIGMENDNDS